MAEQRSGGVTVFCYLGWFVGAYSVVMGFFTLNPLMILGVLYILLSFFLFKLTNWSRISLLIINGIVAAFILFSDALIVFWIVSWTRLVPAESPMDILQVFITVFKEISRSVYPQTPMLTPVLFLVLHIYLFGFLIYFTRPRVREQFRASAPSIDSYLIETPY
jgi:hypothetical protein